MPRYIITLKNARQVIRADKTCRDNNIPATIIATPSDISSECGMSIATDDENIGIIKALLTEIQLKPTVYER